MADPVIPPVVDPNAVIPPVEQVADTPQDEAAIKAAAEAEAAAKAAAEAEGKENDKPDDELDTTIWGTTGDAIGDSVLKVLQDSGVKPETAKALLYDAVKAGDPSKIDRDALIEAVGKANANLILAGVDSFVEKNKTHIQGVLNILHEEVGGKEQWDTMVAWAKENLTADEIDDYIEMVDQGGRKARMAAKDMRERYEEAGNTSLQKDETVIPGKGRPTAPTIQPLSRADYYNEMETLRRTGKLTEAASQALWKRREAGKLKGI